MREDYLAGLATVTMTRIRRAMTNSKQFMILQHELDPVAQRVAASSS